MKIENASAVLMEGDRLCDAIPVLSTVTNLVDIFLKSAFIPSKTDDKVPENRYFTHIREKSYLRCALLLIPFLGNIIVGYWDIKQRMTWGNEAWVMSRLNEQTNDALLQNAPYHVRDSEEQVEKALEQSPWNLEYASERIRNLKSMVEKAVEKDGMVLQYASDELRNDSEVVVKAALQNSNALQFASESVRRNFDIVKTIIERSPRAYVWVLCDEWKYEEKKQAAMAAVEQDGSLLPFVPEVDEDIIIAALKSDHTAKQFVPAHMMRNANILRVCNQVEQESRLRELEKRAEDFRRERGGAANNFI